MSVQCQVPHLIVRFGHASIVHIVRASNDSWVNTWTFKPKLESLALILSLTVWPWAENVQPSYWISLRRNRLCGSNVRVISDHFNQSLIWVACPSHHFSFGFTRAPNCSTETSWSRVAVLSLVYVNDSWNSTKLANEGAISLTFIIDSPSVAYLWKKHIIRAWMSKESEPLRVGADRETLKVLGDNSSDIFVINQLWNRSLICSGRSLQVSYSSVTV